MFKRDVGKDGCEECCHRDVGEDGRVECRHRDVVGLRSL